MHRKMTITLDEAVYDGLHRRVGKRRMSQFIEELIPKRVRTQRRMKCCR